MPSCDTTCAQEELHLSHNDLSHPTTMTTVTAANNGDTVESALTIPEIISSLRSAFRGSDFARAEVVLLSREEKLWREIASGSKIILSLRAELVKKEVELERCRAERNEIREIIKRDKDTIVELQERVCEVENEKRTAESKAERWRTKFEELEARVLLLEREVDGWGEEVQVRRNEETVTFEAEEATDFGNGGPDCHSPDGGGGTVDGEEAGNGGANVNAEVNTENENVKVEFGGETVGALGLGALGEGFGDNGGSDDGDSVEGEGAGSKRPGDLESNQFPNRQSTETEDGDKGKGTSGTGIPVTEDIVEIGDSDDESGSCEILGVKETSTQLVVEGATSGQELGAMGSDIDKRKRSTFTNEGRNDRGESDSDDEPPCKRKMMKQQELIHDRSPGDNCFSSGRASGSKDSQNVLHQSRQGTAVLKQCGEKTRVEHIMQRFLADIDSEDSSSSSGSEDSAISGPKRWESEADMVKRFMEDEQLCMKAVCALYKEEKYAAKLLGGPSACPNRGFKRFERTRGTTLAEFLVDGDPEWRLKKSVAELAAHDEKGLEDCKKIAIAHASQLFEISQQENLFFN
ncbi:hypothetical protein Tsubulata_005663 [Turnera subulata]|uniref:Uncharacterized protein n=1 Tax=Turnera subulata TaxID=218843 RepID=A0A9Q0IZ96_9ROSI|nr:hypothetical protein Tsubulata_005663 [Turnera subulata]